MGFTVSELKMVLVIYVKYHCFRIQNTSGETLHMLKRMQELNSFRCHCLFCHVLSNKLLRSVVETENL